MATRDRELPSALTSLSARLLVLTVLFVILAEFLIWTPSVSRYRKTYMEESIAKAYLSLLALNAMPEQDPGKELSNTLLFHTDAYGIVLNRPDSRVLMLGRDMPPTVDATYDLREATFFGFIVNAFMTLAQTENRVLRIVGVPPKGKDIVVEVIVDEAPMRDAMFDFSARIFNLSIIISLFTATLVYLSLQWLMVRPMRRITRSMARFRADPEHQHSMVPTTGRSDEIGMAQRELAIMQEELRASLRQKNHLAALGAAVAKVNHDLRNTLATAVLVSDRLADIDDPEVKKMAPRLYNAIDRAINLCSQSLRFANDQAPVLRPELFHLRDLVNDVAQEFSSSADDGAKEVTTAQVENRVSGDLAMTADYGLLRRALYNLTLNAVEAGSTTVIVAASSNDGNVVIDVADDGPGLPEKARQNLFQPFAGSVKKGGTGLGLPIVNDIVKSHRGNVEMVRSDATGTLFRIAMPTMAPEAI